MKGIATYTAILLLLILPVRCAFSEEPVGTLNYVPNAVARTIPAGSSWSFAVSFDVTDARSSMYAVMIPHEMTDGNLPCDWITSTPSWKFLSPGTPIETTITVAVPSGTPVGTYGGHMTALARCAHGVAGPGAGLYIEVAVPPECSGVPDIVIHPAGPVILWPPDRALEYVTISGTVTAPAGCTVLETGYAIEDEYGVYSTVGAFTRSADNGYRISLQLEAWREGNDLDGRQYAITLFGRDEAGIGTSRTFRVLVPHDIRN